MAASWLTATRRTTRGRTTSTTTTRTTAAAAATARTIRRRDQAGMVGYSTRGSSPLNKEPSMDIKALVVGFATRYGMQVLGAIVILVAGLLVGRWIGGLVDARLRGRAMEPPMRVLIVRLLKVLVMLFAGVVALDQVGFQVAPLVAGIGVAGVGIGLALQGVLSNIMAGLTIIFTKPFRVGEYIEIVGVRGDVMAIDLSSTTLLHPDRSRVIVPNRKIVGEILHNFGHTRQLDVTITVPHEADLARVFGAAMAAIAADPRL